MPLGMVKGPLARPLGLNRKFEMTLVISRNEKGTHDHLTTRFTPTVFTQPCAGSLVP